MWDNQVHSCSSEDAVEAYLMLSKELQVQGFTRTQTLPPRAEKMISQSLQQVSLTHHNVLSYLLTYFYIHSNENSDALSGLKLFKVHRNGSVFGFFSYQKVHTFCTAFYRIKLNQCKVLLLIIRIVLR